jgi:hypothetical protein
VNSKKTVFAIVTIVAILTVVIGLGIMAGCLIPRGSQPDGQEFHLKSGCFAIPIQIPTDPEKRAITSIELQGELCDGKQTPGSITFNQSRLRFNDFGDASEIDKDSPEPIRIAYKPVHQAGKIFRVFELVFPKRDFKNRIYLSMIAGSADATHLLIRPGEKVPDEVRETGDTHRMELRLAHQLPLGAVGGEGLDPREPLRDHISMRTGYFPSARTKPALSCIQFRGVLGGNGVFTHDRNGVRFLPLTGGVITTAAGFPDWPMTLQEVNVFDPTDAGRRLLRIIFADGSKKDRYSVVVCPDAAGPHRLIVRDRKNVTHVLPLRPCDLSWFYGPQTLLARTPIAQQQAIAEIRRLSKQAFFVHFKIESRTIVELKLSPSTGTDQTLEQLKHFGDLKRLTLTACYKLSTAGLKPVGSLENLEWLSFDYTPITDDGLKHITGLTKLKFLNLAGEPFRRGGLAVNPEITDAGLKHLERLVNLESLKIYGHHGVTDAGLAHLEGMTRLKKLYFDGTQVTLEGIAKLSAALPNTEIIVGEFRDKPKR